MIDQAEVAFKDSGFDWLGEIPENWQVKPFWTLYRKAKSTGHPEEELLSVYRDYGVIPKSSRDDNGNVESEDLNAYQLVEPNDLVMNKMKAWQGSIAVSDIRGIVSPAYFVFKPRHNAHGPYLHHLLRSKKYIGEYNRLSKGIRVGQWDLEPTAFRTTPVVLPPFDEQVSIAEFLDRETTQIDELIAKQNLLIQSLSELRTTTIKLAVTKGLEPGVALKSTRYHWLDSTPTHWRVLPIKRVATTGAGAGFPIEYQGLSDEEITFLKVNSLSRANSLGVISSRDDTVSRSTANKLNARIYPAGSIVLAKIGAALLLGRIRIAGGDSCIDNNMMAITPSSEVDARFLFYALTLVDFAYIVNPGTVPSTSEGAVGNFHLSIPPLPEQRAIAQYLDEKTHRIDLLAEKAEKTVEVLTERRQALISAAVTGKIDVQGK